MPLCHELLELGALGVLLVRGIDLDLDSLALVGVETRASMITLAVTCSSSLAAVRRTSRS
ncbi:MAG: hypothetical protein M3350_06575 [Actinomycetota bacterium]|nr:hypothetical protein [Actinomycetota bacterium]